MDKGPPATSFSLDRLFEGSFSEPVAVRGAGVESFHIRIWGHGSACATGVGGSPSSVGVARLLSSRAVTPCCSPHGAPLPGAPASRRWQSDFPSRHPAGPRSLHRAASDVWGRIILCRGGCRVCCGVCSSVRSPRRHRQHCPLGNDNQYVSTHSRMSPGRAKPHTVKSHWVKSIPQGLGFFLTVDLEIILTHR